LFKCEKHAYEFLRPHGKYRRASTISKIRIATTKMRVGRTSPLRAATWQYQTAGTGLPHYRPFFVAAYRTELTSLLNRH
jgi:hypothetical protein